MSTIAHSLRRVIFRGRTAPDVVASPPDAESAGPAIAEPSPVDIAPNDPIIAFFQSAPGAIDIEGLELESPALDQLRAAGVRLVVPLVTQGELIGLLNLGPRLSDQEYSGDDRRLLESLAAQAAPAVRVGQLVREQEAEIRSRERLDQELAVARLIQQNFLPRQVPELDGWGVAADYRPAREVGGDFYDFIDLPDGRLGIVIGDVTDKGVPAALVMAATRSVLRASAQRLLEPGAVLERVNEHLCPDIPENMFVTCLYGVLEPDTGRLVFANAGHNLPVMSVDGVVSELRARGMPLGLMTGYRGGTEDAASATSGAYYRTGDVATCDADGYFTCVGRADDLFKASDYLISPFELESVLMEHEAVAEAAVVPVPDPMRLARPKAYVTLAPGREPTRATALEIMRFARDRLAPYKRIRRLQFATLPKTVSGKTRRVDLRHDEIVRADAHPAEHGTLEFWEEDFPELKR